MNIMTSQRPALLHTGAFFLRTMTGLILFIAGAGKVLGWFGGFGMEFTLNAFKSGMDLSPFWAYLSSYTEFIGGFLVMVGFLVRPASFALFINMLMACVLTGTKNFFMGGAAYPCLLMFCFLYFLLAGPSPWSIDALVWNRKKNDP